MFKLLLDPLDNEQLRRLQQHQYRSTGKSVLDTHLQTYWEWVVQQCPEWLAPNLMTIMGLLVNVVSCAILMILSPDARQDVSPIWFIFCAVGLFIYQTLDACDGKQARRTGSSSPLGELFDHGCDAISTIFVCMGVAVATKLGDYPYVLLAQTCLSVFLFYCAHWQTYVTGTLRFGNFDVTETQFSVMTVHLASAIFGQGMWSVKLLGLIELRFIPVICAFLGAGFAIFNYITVSRSNNTQTVCEGSSFAPMVPAFLTFIPMTMVALKSPSLMMNQPMLFMMTFGLMAVKLTFRLIVAHMTRSELSTWDPTFLAVLVIIFNQYCENPINEKILLYVAFVFIVVDLLVYAKRICDDICEHLSIELFRIKPINPNDKKNSIDNLTQDKPLLKSKGTNSLHDKPPSYSDVILEKS